jgi:hypothetical protein
MYTQKDGQQLAKDYLNNESIFDFYSFLHIWNILVYFPIQKQKMRSNSWFAKYFGFII